MRKINFDVPTRIIYLIVLVVEKLPYFGLVWIFSHMAGGVSWFNPIWKLSLTQLLAHSSLPYW